MRIAVVALGKIGLPLAAQFAGQGHQVIGVDTNAHVVRLVNEGVEPFPGEADLARRLREVVGNGSLAATAVAAVAQPGTLISYETTLPVGATRDRLGPMLEAGSGLKVGQDLFLVFSPERVFTGRVFADLRKYPKLVGGVGAESTRRGVAFYEVIEACEANAAMPQYAIGILAQGYGGLTGAKVAVLGASYRGGIKETVLPGVRVLLDGRRITQAEDWPSVNPVVLGAPCLPAPTPQGLE